MLETIFQNPSKQVLSKYQPQVDKINALENSLSSCTDLELQQKTQNLSPSSSLPYIFYSENVKQCDLQLKYCSYAFRVDVRSNVKASWPHFAIFGANWQSSRNVSIRFETQRY